MKKRDFKSLNLNKTSISNLHGLLIKGGAVSISKTLVSIIDGPGCDSHAGCTGGPHETLTCPYQSCACSGPITGCTR